MNQNPVPELYYIVLLFALFVLPKFLQRYDIPQAVTSFVMGAISSLGLNLFHQDSTVQFLATFGIVSLFLFNGMEIDFSTLITKRGKIIIFIVSQMILLAVFAIIFYKFFQQGLRVSILISLALSTPSAGFILDNLDAWGFDKTEKSWIKAKVISNEILALLILFIILQSTSIYQIGLSLSILVGMIVILPVIFKLFARIIIPYAPKSEFAFLLMVAVLSAFITRRLGVYYLVGAFVVGVSAQNFKRWLPALGTDNMLHSVEVFASFFIPFYFFQAGLQLNRSDFQLLSSLWQLHS
jgi:Kef-type K+ transport system membrane component KefB